MQKAIFSLTSPREFESAYSNGYVIGSVHPRRVMSVHDLVYITEGEWEIYQNGEAFMLHADDVIVLSAWQSHGGERPCAAGTKTTFLHVSAQGDSFSSDGEPECGEDFVVLPTVIRCAAHPQVKKYFEAIVSTFSLDESYKETRLTLLFRMLLLELFEAANTPNVNADFEFTEKILHAIHNAPNRFFTNGELADMLFVCSKTVVNRFSSRTGMTPYQYQLRYKLQSVAATLITHPSMKLRELAQNFGFYDEFHLSRAFKKEFGISPSEYKTLHRD